MVIDILEYFEFWGIEIDKTSGIVYLYKVEFGYYSSFNCMSIVLNVNSDIIVK